MNMIKVLKNQVKEIFIIKINKKIITVMKTKEMIINIRKMTIKKKKLLQDHSRIDI